MSLPSDADDAPVCLWPNPGTHTFCLWRAPHEYPPYDPVLTLSTP